MRKRRASRQRGLARAASVPAVCLVSLFFLIVLPSVAGPVKYRLSARAWPGDRQTDQSAVRLNVDLVVLHATVQDGKRTSVSGLVKEDFQVYEDGVLQQVNAFSHEDIPVTVGLVIDNSGSMMQKRAEVIFAARAFARSSNPDDQFFVVNFNENVSFGLPGDTPFANKAASLEMALSTIGANGETALYDAVDAALEHLTKGNRDKKVLILISDGGDNASHHNLSQVMAAAKQSDAIIYTIGLFDFDDPDRNPRMLKHLAEATGGEAFLPQSLKEAVPICERIARDIRSQYTIAYVPTNTDRDGKYRVIQVKARNPSLGRLSVRTRAGYYAPTKPQ